MSDDLFAPFTDIAGTKSFTPNSLNQYTSAMAEAIVHDLNGNMSSDGTNDYVHDAVNRLITATVGSTTWTYAYGPLDRRMSKADGTNTIQYLYDNDRAVAEYSGTGTLLRKYVYGPGLDEPIMMIVPGDPSETVYYYHADGQGTIIGLTNDSGAWVEKYAYTLYGKPAAASTVGNPYMYTGRRLDAETGLYYYRARYYDPHLRRFIETDPIGYAGGMNLYAYVGNSSVNFVDPYGLENLGLQVMKAVQWRVNLSGLPGIGENIKMFTDFNLDALSSPKIDSYDLGLQAMKAVQWRINLSGLPGIGENIGMCTNFDLDAFLDALSPPEESFQDRILRGNIEMAWKIESSGLKEAIQAGAGHPMHWEQTAMYYFYAYPAAKRAGRKGYYERYEASKPWGHSFFGNEHH